LKDSTWKRATTGATAAQSEADERIGRRVENLNALAENLYTRSGRAGIPMEISP